MIVFPALRVQTTAGGDQWFCISIDSDWLRRQLERVRNFILTRGMGGVQDESFELSWETDKYSRVILVGCYLLYAAKRGRQRLASKKKISFFFFSPFVFSPAFNKLWLGAERQEFFHNFLKISRPELKDHSAKKLFLENRGLFFVVLKECGTQNKKD